MPCLVFMAIGVYVHVHVHIYIITASAKNVGSRDPEIG